MGMSFMQKFRRAKNQIKHCFWVLKFCLGNLTFTCASAVLQNSTFNDALLPFVFLVFVLLLWSFIIPFTKTFGVLLFSPGMACCTIRALLKALIIFFLVVIKLCLQQTTEFSVWTHRSPCNFLLLLSLGTVSLTFLGSDQFFHQQGHVISNSFTFLVDI